MHVHSCHLNRPLVGLFSLLHACFKSILFKPSIVQGWMYHGNIVAIALKLLLPKSSIYWNIRTCIDDKHQFNVGLKLVLRLNKLLSRFVDVCIYNSNKAYLQHSSWGSAS